MHLAFRDGPPEGVAFPRRLSHKRSAGGDAGARMRV